MMSRLKLKMYIRYSIEYYIFINMVVVVVGSLVTKSCLTLVRPLCLWDSPGKNAGMGCHFLLQWIIQTQGSNPGLLHRRQILYHLSHQGSPAAAAAESLQSCPTLCDPIDGSPPGSPVPGILQARTLEWAAISFSSA